MTVYSDARYNFAPQFLMGARWSSDQARELELELSNSDDDRIASHRGAVVSAVLQSCCAMEAEISQVCLEGPGHQLGSNGKDAVALAFLRPIADMIDDLPTLDRYTTVLHLLHRPSLDRGGRVWEMADLLVKLRNELVHYKPRYGVATDGPKLVKRLEQLRHDPPGYLGAGMVPFPLRYLSAATASWAVTTALDLIDEFYRQLGGANPFDPHRSRF